MATGDITIYNFFKAQLLEGEIDLENDTILCALVAGYSPDIDEDEFWDDIDGDEVSGDGYSAGGATLTGKSVTKNTTADAGVFSASNVVFEDLDVGTPSHAILYRDSGQAESSALICAVELGVASNGQDYTIQWHASGIIRIT